MGYFYRLLSLGGILAFSPDLGNCMESPTNQALNCCRNGSTIYEGCTLSVPLFMVNNETGEDITLKVGFIINEIPYFDSKGPENKITNIPISKEVAPENRHHSAVTYKDVTYKFIAIKSCIESTPIFIKINTHESCTYENSYDADTSEKSIDITNVNPFGLIELTNCIDLNRQIDFSSSSNSLRAFKLKHDYPERPIQSDLVHSLKTKKNWKKKLLGNFVNIKKTKKVKPLTEVNETDTVKNNKNHAYDYYLLSPHDFGNLKSQLFPLNKDGFYTHNHVEKKYYNVILCIVSFSFSPPFYERTILEFDHQTYTFQKKKCYTIRKLSNKIDIYGSDDRELLAEEARKIYLFLRNPSSSFSHFPSELIKIISHTYMMSLFYDEKRLDSSYFKRGYGCGGWTIIESPPEEITNSLVKNNQQNHILRIR